VLLVWHSFDFATGGALRYRYAIAGSASRKSVLPRGKQAESMKPYGDPVAGVNASPVPEAHTRLLSGFGDILERRALTPLFQPIADLRTGDIVGYEGLIRGPVDSQLFSPEVLFRVAGASGRSLELES